MTCLRDVVDGIVGRVEIRIRSLVSWNKSMKCYVLYIMNEYFTCVDG